MYNVQNIYFDGMYSLEKHSSITTILDTIRKHLIQVTMLYDLVHVRTICMLHHCVKHVLLMDSGFILQKMNLPSLHYVCKLPDMSISLCFSQWSKGGWGT